MAPVEVYNWDDLANVKLEGEEEEVALSPMEKLYFTGSMLEKYEPAVDALQKILDGDGEDEESWNDFEVHFDKFMNMTCFSNWNGKKYDLVLYGVSGYTGYLTMQYLKRVAFERNPEPFTVAFAGRTRSKVEEMRNRNFGDTKWATTDIITASYDDVQSMIDLARSAYVIVNVAGPYSLAQGEVLIDACCHVGTHYCDVSGEMPWTLRTLELHAHAKQGGALISPSAAVAGCWSDLCTYMCAKKAREEYGEELRWTRGYSTGGGAGAGASGGTLASRNAMSTAPDEVRKRMADPFGLSGFVPDIDRNGMKEVLIEHGTGKVTNKIRRDDQDAVLSKVGYDNDVGVWRAPFVYAYFNTRIVRRSNAMFADLENRPYGRALNHQEFGLLPPEAGDMIMAAQKGGAAPAPAGPSVAGEKEALEAMGKYYQQGEGPPLEELSDAWTCFMMWAKTPSGKVVRCGMCGNDGYFETARCAIEWALTMRFDYDSLPHKGGVLNAIVSGQEAYIRRLIGSGLKWKMGSWFEASELGPVGFATPGTKI